MAVSLVLNRQSLATFRATLNTWAAAINSLLTRMTTAESNIATNTSDISDLEAELAGISNKYVYVTRSSSGSLGTNELQSIVEYTAATPLNFDLTAPSSIDFETGNWFVLTNLPSSGNDVTFTTPGGVALIGSTTVAPGISALVVCKDATVGAAIYIRIY